MACVKQQACFVLSFATGLPLHDFTTCTLSLR
jgi:hypothetical protein